MLDEKKVKRKCFWSLGQWWWMHTVYLSRLWWLFLPSLSMLVSLRVFPRASAPLDLQPIPSWFLPFSWPYKMLTRTTPNLYVKPGASSEPQTHRCISRTFPLQFPQFSRLLKLLPSIHRASFCLSKWQYSHSPNQDQTPRGILNFSPSLAPFSHSVASSFSSTFRIHLEYDCVYPAPRLPHWVWSASSLDDICTVASQWVFPLSLCLTNQQLE